MKNILDKRSRKILSEVVQNYLDTGDPIGSRTISKHSELDLSPATVRNIMADLVDIGLLRQPHVSSGRIPTENGLRLYVDRILEIEQLSTDEKGTIEQNISKQSYDVPGMLMEASKVLSKLSEHTSIVMAPRASHVSLKHIEFILLRKKIVLVILVDQTGKVQNRILETSDSLDQDDLVRFSNYLNNLLHDLSLSQVRTTIVQEMQKEKIKFDELLSRALRLSEQAFRDADDEEVYIQGQTAFLDQREFASVEAMKKIFQALEEKTKLINLLAKTMNAEGAQIFIGSECNLEGLQDVSVITSSYRKNYFPLGVLAVIGPTRMNYSRVISIVDYTAKMVSNIFNTI